MINIFNRAELFVDTSSEAAAKVWSKLEDAGIEYELVTRQSGGDVRAHNGVIGLNGSVGGNYIGDKAYNIYKIYVKKADFVRAKAVCAL